MTPLKAKILIVEDDSLVRESLEHIFLTLGYEVRTATDGLKAVAALRQLVPDILLTDLNMPGMTGFELLSIVGRRFPTVRAVAMSGAFGGDEIPDGLYADGFYQKGCGVPTLLKTVDKAHAADRPTDIPHRIIWMQKTHYEALGENSVMIACPECFRTFPQEVRATDSTILGTSCVFCEGLIHFAVAPTLELQFPPWSRPSARFESH